MPDKTPAHQPAAGTRSRDAIPPLGWGILVSALAWAVIFIAIPPARQDFPLGDDWAFAHGAIWFAQGQGIHYSGWASMPQLGQWLWSWPFLLVTHLPHVALRVSVIVLSWLGLMAFFDLLRPEMSLRLAGFATCVLALNPLIFLSSGTYMTDMPALSFALLALDFYARALRGQNLRWLLAALALSVCAVITRQTMLAVPLVAGLMLLRNPEIRWKPVWLLSICLPVVVCLYTAWWFSKRPDVLPMQPTFNMREMLFRPFLVLHLCGLTVLPLCWLVARRRDFGIFLLALTLMVLAAAGFLYFGKGFPYGGLFPYCNGMLSLEGTYSDGLVVGQRDILLTPWLRLGLTILGCVGGAAILTGLVQTVRARTFPGMLMAFTAVQFLILLILPYSMDRYVEILFPGAILLVASSGATARTGWLAGIIGIFLYGLVSVGLFHDWLAWNSVRWDLGRQAIATKVIQPADIEGGFEWNGWYACSEPDKPLPARGDGRAGDDSASLTLPFSRRYFPEVTGRFALAFTAPDNTVVVASLPYQTWVPPAGKKFLLVQRRP